MGIAIFCLPVYDAGMSPVRRLALLLLLTAISSLSLSNAALAIQPVKLQALLTSSGNGRLLVDSSGSGWRWESCTAHPVACTNVQGGRELHVPSSSQGTVFVVRSPGWRGISPEWTGSLKASAPPRVDGELRGGGYADPIPGRWVGGWRGEYSEFQLAACTGPEGAGCVALTSPHYLRPCPADASFALPSWSAGRYLQVAERRVGAQPAAMPAFGLTSPAGEQVWTQGPTVAVATDGQISPSAGATTECGPPIEPRAWISRKGVASIECVGGCHAELVVGQGSDVRRIAGTLSPHGPLVVPPARELRIPETSLERFGPGRLRYAVVIDGRQVAVRTVTSPVARG